MYPETVTPQPGRDLPPGGVILLGVTQEHVRPVPVEQVGRGKAEHPRHPRDFAGLDLPVVALDFGDGGSGERSGPSLVVLLRELFCAPALG